MKVYSISKWTFRAICLLILILPVSRHWRLLSTGEKARGTVTEQVIRKKEILGKETDAGFASEIQFEVDGKNYQAYGPLNYEYAPGRSIMVFYVPEEPSQNCIATFGGFYHNNYLVLPIILLVLWAAFYMSFNNYSRKQRFKKSQWKAQPFRRIS